MADDLLKGASSGSRWTAFLSGIGYYRLSVRRRRILGIVLGCSLLIHVIGLAIFGGYIVMTSHTEEPTVFRTPPPARTYKPRELEHRVKVQKRQRSSSRPAMLPRLVAMKPSNLALPEIKVDPKIIHTTFQPKFKAISGKGLGAGLGTGYGTHGFGQGVSSIDFFGIRARGERIAVLVDVSVSMVEEQRGGVAGYMAVKSRVERVIDALSPMSIFSLTVFADAADTCFPKMVVATDENKNKARMYLRPFNTEGNWGLTHGNVNQSSSGVPAAGGTTRLDLAITQAMTQMADTILIISDGIPRVRKSWSPEQMQQFNQQRAAWYQNNAGRVESWQRANASYQANVQTTTERVWVPPTPAVPARPPPKGPPKEGESRHGTPGRPAVPGHWETRTHRVGGGGGGPGPQPKPPPIPDPGWWTLADFVKHINLLYERYYKKAGKPMPVIHCIGYQIDDQGHAFLQGLAKQFHGNYRRVARMR
ncbi:MAG: hypothetical protein ACK2U9_00205 [Anaerolineae bacterium]